MAIAPAHGRATKGTGLQRKSADEDGFDLIIRCDGDIAWMGICGEFDLARVPEVEREIREVEESDAFRIIINLQEVTFMDSSALQLLLGARNRMGADPGRLQILGFRHEAVIQLIQLTGTEEAFG